MPKTMFDVMCETKKKYNTENNTFDMFPVGTKVRVITPCQDFHFFYGETGVVTKNGGRYLSIIVEFDEPRHFEGGHIQYDFNFEPSDLLLLNIGSDLFEIE